MNVDDGDMDGDDGDMDGDDGDMNGDNSDDSGNGDDGDDSSNGDDGGDSGNGDDGDDSGNDDNGENKPDEMTVETCEIKTVALDTAGGEDITETCTSVTDNGDCTETIRVTKIKTVTWPNGKQLGPINYKHPDITRDIEGCALV